MDAQGNVIDSTKIESGSGRTVKGMNDYEGEITGNPAPNSKFTRLQIGMSLKQVTDLAGGIPIPRVRRANTCWRRPRVKPQPVLALMNHVSWRGPQR